RLVTSLSRVHRVGPSQAVAVGGADTPTAAYLGTKWEKRRASRRRESRPWRGSVEMGKPWNKWKFGLAVIAPSLYLQLFGLPSSAAVRSLLVTIGYVLSPPPRLLFSYRRHYERHILPIEQEEKEWTRRRRKIAPNLRGPIGEYARWHASVRSNATALRSEDTKFLVVETDGRHNGGLGDRLRGLPYFFLEAARTQRILLIHWKIPWDLENFLLPPLGGMDWTVPKDFYQYNEVSHQSEFKFDGVDSMIFRNPDLYQAQRTIKVPSGVGCVVYEKCMPHVLSALNISLADGGHLVSDIYRLLFELAPPVQRRMERELNRMELRNQHYVAAHFRARVDGKFQKALGARSVDADGILMTEEAKVNIRKCSKHAVQCVLSEFNRSKSAANHSQVGAKVYFASDTNEAVKMMTSDSRGAEGVPTSEIVGLATAIERLHLDRMDRIGFRFLRRTPPAAFYPAFIDLWILSQASCIAIGIRGYGRLAAMMGNVPCVINHQEPASKDEGTLLQIKRQC
ncbi:hypothetical protein ACHAWF_001468, partial [Thalassiosira exigua]